MNFTALLLSLGLMGTVCSRPLCPLGCQHVMEYHTPFVYVSDLKDSSVAPWSLKAHHELNREPAIIYYAHCMNCTVPKMSSEPIYVQISVYKPIYNGIKREWCKCPFDLAVGCTCVKHQS